jgi:hypothetical protein
MIFYFPIHHVRLILPRSVGRWLANPHIFREYADNANQVKSGSWQLIACLISGVATMIVFLAVRQLLLSGHTLT